MVCSDPRSKCRNYFCSTTQIPSARSPACQHFVWGHLIFVGPEFGTCFMLLLTPRILRAVLIFGKFVHHSILVFVSIQLHMILSYLSGWNAFNLGGNLISLLALKLNLPVFLGPDTGRICIWCPGFSHVCVQPCISWQQFPQKLSNSINIHFHFLNLSQSSLSTLTCIVDKAFLFFQLWHVLWVSFMIVFPDTGI